jgi:hypothetical protein
MQQTSTPFYISLIQMRINFLLGFILFSALAFAQKNNELIAPQDYKAHCRSSFEQIKLGTKANADLIKEYLIKHISNLKDDKVDLRLNYQKESPGGFHYSFTQLYKGVEVYQSEIKVNLDRQNTIYAVFDNSFNTSAWDIVTDNADSNSVIATDPNLQQFKLATRKVENHSKEVLQADGITLYEHDLRSYFAPDSMVSGKIFNPDPLTSAQQFYGGIYTDDSDRNAPWLDAQLQTVNFKASFNGSQFLLENQYLRVLDFDSPNIPPVIAHTPQFYYNRSQSGFEDVNAYYHLTKCREHLESLGYSLASQLLWIDPHGGGDISVDQSYFEPAYSPPRISYGMGGVDDAEDADVLTHEFGHFISYNAAPNSNNGSERNSLDEAFGDYNAASYSKAISTFNCDWVFNWDGHNPFWNGRIVNSSKNYLTDFVGGAIYKNAEIWSSPLMSIHDDIGRTTLDSLIYEVHYDYSSNMPMSDAAQLLIIVDSILDHGAHYCPILKHLLEHGLVSYRANPCGISSIQDYVELPVQFLQDGRAFTIQSNNLAGLKMDIINLTGQVIAGGIEINQSSYSYANANLPNGVYLVTLYTSSARQTFKWCKAE